MASKTSMVTGGEVRRNMATAALILLACIAIRIDANAVLVPSCPAGNYSVSGAACQACPPGSVTNTLGSPGATSCSPCAAGRFSASSMTVCAPCPMCHSRSIFINNLFIGLYNDGTVCSVITHRSNTPTQKILSRINMHNSRPILRIAPHVSVSAI
jgi:hypothetical protein